MEVYLIYAGCVAILSLAAWFSLGYWGAACMIIGLCMAGSTIILNLLGSLLNKAMRSSRGASKAEKAISAFRIGFGIFLFFLPGLVRLLG